MATITYKCGHTAEMQIKSKDLRYAIKKYEGRLCQNCFNEKLAADRAAESAKAAEAAKQAGLPQLVGSPKQIAWAESIRAEKIAELNIVLEELNSDQETMDQSDIAIAKEIINYITNTTDAATWIERSNKTMDYGFILNRIHDAKRPIEKRVAYYDGYPYGVKV